LNQRKKTMKNWKRDDQATQDLLDLGSDKLAMLGVIATWTDEQCRQAEAWASARHFHASDNAVRVPKIPPHVAALPERACGVYDADLSHL
jgi:hypothetical protein